MSSRTKSLRGRVTRQGSQRPAKPPRRAPSFGEFRSLSGPQVDQGTGRRRDGLLCQQGMGMWLVIARNASLWNRGVNCARSWLSHSLLYITLASQCRRERAAFTRQPGPDALDLQVIASLYVTLLTSAKRNARDHTCMLQQQPQSRAEAVGTLHRLTDLHAILLSHA